LLAIIMGYIHKIKSWGCTLSTNFNDCLFWNFLNIYWKYSICKLQKVIRKSFWFKNMLHHIIMWICVLRDSPKLCHISSPLKIIYEFFQ
jgi:hypothetical protein